MDNLRAKKGLGQNFLEDKIVLQKIANSFETNKNDLIIEIGPGKGALTKYLIEKEGNLLCYEIDERMKPKLDTFQSDNTQIIYDDFLKRNIISDVRKKYENIFVIANIPYYITTPIIEHLIDSELSINGMTLLVQKEVAERFCAYSKTKDYGYFTVYLNHFFQIEKLFDVSPKSFNPEPKVFSSVVRFISKKEVDFVDILTFQRFLKESFSHKRKTLKNNLKEYDWNNVLIFLKNHNKSESIRAEELSYEEFLELFMQLYKTS